MPYTVIGEPGSWKTPVDSYREDLGYKYPYDLDLRPDSDFHKKLRSRIWERAHASRMEISKRFDHWNEIDRTLTAYIPLKDEEEIIKEKDDTKPLSIVFPYSYSSLEAVMTYMTMAFFQDPMLQYEGVDDEDTIGAMLLELVIRMHCIRNKVALNVHTVLRDNFSYGIGIAIPEWTRQWGRKPIISSPLIQSPLDTTQGRYIRMERSLLYEGNSLSNIEPYMWLPDPSVSSADIQKGEFVGWVDRTNYMKLLADESELDSKYFNVKYLKSRKDKRSTLALDQSDRQERHGGSTDLNRSMTDTVNPVDRICMHITLIPKDWELSDNEYPEKWYFELAADDVIIRCEEAEHNHGKYPMLVASSEYDGYSVTPIGRLEILYGLQHTLDFLFNSHIANVRKAINDMLVVDPYLVNIEDLKDPKPGKLIRLRRPAWGRGVDKVVQQLEVQDITRLNIADSSYITQWMDRISGADQSMQGALRQGGPERLTGTEFEGTRSSAMGRMQRVAQIIGMQFFQDMGMMFAVHTQELMQQDTFVRIAGPKAAEMQKIFGRKTKSVSPFDLVVDYDLILRDGSIPGGNFSSAWMELFKVIGTTPELLQHFDVTRIFMHIASQLGARNVEDFKRNLDQIQPTIMPDETVARQVEAGNMIPVGA